MRTDSCLLHGLSLHDALPIWLGGRPVGFPYVTATLPLANKIASAVGRVDYVRVRVRDGHADPLTVSGASMLSTTTAARSEERRVGKEGRGGALVEDSTVSMTR